MIGKGASFTDVVSKLITWRICSSQGTSAQFCLWSLFGALCFLVCPGSRAWREPAALWNVVQQTNVENRHNGSLVHQDSFYSRYCTVREWFSLNWLCKKQKKTTKNSLNISVVEIMSAIYNSSFSVTQKTLTCSGKSRKRTTLSAAGQQGDIDSRNSGV